MASAFQKVRNEFIADAASSLQKLGIQVKQQAGDWLSVLCPLCSDTSGSCSVSVQSGYLRCHQCQNKAELFTWYSQWRNLADTWDGCKSLATELNVELAPPKVSRARMVRAMDTKILERVEHDLWEEDEAEPIRRFLASRGLGDPALAASLHLGYLNGKLVFPQFEHTGLLRPRARLYDINPSRRSKWAWLGREGSAAGLWPAWLKPDKDSVIWIVEGEWDTISARFVLNLWEQGIHAYCWTSPMAGLHPDRLPPWLRGREVHVIYDNDTFQTPLADDQVAPSEKDARAMRLRREALISRVAGPLHKRMDCKVFLRAIPIDPLDKWGGDLRDWVDAGNRNIDEIPKWSYESVVSAKRPPAQVTFTEAYEHARHGVKFRGLVDGVEQEGTVIPKLCKLTCRMGEIRPCDNCLGPDRFPDGLIDFSEYPDQLARVLVARDPEREILKTVVGKPNQCNYAEVSIEEYNDGCAWYAADAQSERFSQRALFVVSKQVPSLSSEVEITGTVRHVGKTVMVIAKKVHDIEATDIDIKDVLLPISELCPSKTNKAEEIEDYFQKRAADLAANVTRIYGRPDLHTTVDLVAHSALWLNIDGRMRRGWIDAAICGDTRTGKTVVARELLNYYGVGRFVSCLENISRAGLTLGMSVDRQGTRMRPGLFPRSHQKMLVLDEFHYMVDKDGDSPMRHLQAARDIGEVMGVKIYGTHSLKAAVRLLTIANWAREKKATYRWPCEHFLYLYGSPESVARTDFGLIVHRTADVGRMMAKSSWKSQFAQALVLRAWAMTPDRIIITPEANQLAFDICDEWADIYAEDLPLFTKGEKVFSLLRIAVSVANATFSFPEGDDTKCEVRPCHVEWAAEWVKYTWRISKYLHYSLNAPSKREVTRAFEAESLLTTYLMLEDPEDAANILEHLLGQNQRSQLSSILGKEPHEVDKWTRTLVGCGVLHSAKATNGYNVVIQPTVAGHTMMTNLLDLAENYPAAWTDRYQKIKAWSFDKHARKPSLPPITNKIEALRESWEKDIVEGPWNGTS